MRIRENIPFLLFLTLAIMISIPMATAADWDNVKSYDAVGNKITVTDNLGLGGTLAEYYLLENTDECISDCYAIGNVTLYEQDTLFDGMEFYEKDGDTSTIPNNLYIEKTYTQNISQPIYEISCDTNWTWSEEVPSMPCWKNITGENPPLVKTWNEWELYEGEELLGDYRWKLTGKITLHKSGLGYDWVGETMGVTLEEWAWWDNNWDLCKPLNFNDNANVGWDYTHPIKANLTGLTFANANEVRIINATCDDGGSEIPFDILSSGTGTGTAYAYVEFVANVSNNYSVYYDNTGASAPTTESRDPLLDVYVSGESWHINNSYVAFETTTGIQISNVYYDETGQGSHKSITPTQWFNTPRIDGVTGGSAGIGTGDTQLAVNAFDNTTVKKSVEMGTRVIDGDLEYDYYGNYTTWENYPLVFFNGSYTWIASVEDNYELQWETANFPTTGTQHCASSGGDFGSLTWSCSTATNFQYTTDADTTNQIVAAAINAGDTISHGRVILNQDLIIETNDEAGKIYSSGAIIQTQFGSWIRRNNAPFTSGTLTNTSTVLIGFLESNSTELWEDYGIIWTNEPTASLGSEVSPGAPPTTSQNSPADSYRQTKNLTLNFDFTTTSAADNITNQTFKLWNGGTLVNETTYNYYPLVDNDTTQNEVLTLNWELHPQGTYSWEVEGCTTVNGCDTAGNRTVVFNTTPYIEYISPTYDNGTTQDITSIPIRANVTDGEFWNATVQVWNSTGIQETADVYVNPIEYNTTFELVNTEYFYNVTAYDNETQSNSTEIRTINILGTDQTVTLQTPTDDSTIITGTENFVAEGTTALRTINSTLYTNQSGTFEAVAWKNHTYGTIDPQDTTQTRFDNISGILNTDNKQYASGYARWNVASWTGSLGKSERGIALSSLPITEELYSLNFTGSVFSIRANPSNGDRANYTVTIFGNEVYSYNQTFDTFGTTDQHGYYVENNGTINFFDVYQDDILLETIFATDNEVYMEFTLEAVDATKFQSYTMGFQNSLTALETVAATGYTTGDYSFEHPVTDGEYFEWNTEICDTSGGCEMAGTNFAATTNIAPSIEFITPTPTDSEEITTRTFTVGYNETNNVIDNSTFQLYYQGGALIEQQSNTSNPGTYTVQTTLENGFYEYNITGYKGAQEASSGTRTIEINSTEVILLSPTDGSTASITNVTFEANASFFEPLVNSSLYSNSTGTWQIEETQTIPAFLETETIPGSWTPNTGVGGVGQYSGMYITPAEDFEVTYIDTEGGDSFTACAILWANLTVIEEVAVTPIVPGCTMPGGTILEAGNNYAIAVKTLADNYDRITTPTYPIEMNKYNITNGLRNNAGSTSHWIIKQITIQNQVINSTNTFYLTIAEGTEWNVEYCDETGYCDTGINNYTILADTTTPVITLTSPIDNFLETDGEEIFLNWSITEAGTLEECWYEYAGTNNTVTCGALTETINYDYPNNNITFWANDSFSNLGTTTRTWNYEVVITGETYDAEVVETTATTFEFDLYHNSTGWNTVVSNLTYDGVGYTGTQTGTGDDITFTRTITAPSVTADENKTFYWTIYFTNATGTYPVVSETRNQTVSEVTFGLCGIGETPFINFTTLTATNPIQIINATFESNWQIYDAAGDGSIVKNETYQDLTETNSTWQFCISPNSSNYTVSMQSVADASTFTPTNYYLTDTTFTGTTQNVEMYLLNDSLATLTEIQVVDNSYTGIEGVLVFVQRYDVGTDTYYNVDMAKTSFDGTDLIYLNWYDTWYRFILVRDGETVETTTAKKISSTPQTFQIADTATFDYRKFGEIEYTLNYVNTTQNFVLTYVLPSAEVTSGCLKVIKRNVTNDYTICNVCETSSSATMYCDVSTQGNGTFIASFYATGSIDVVDRIYEFIGVPAQVYEELGNLDGTALAIITAGIVVSMFLFSPAMAIIGMILGMGAAFALGFQPMNIMTFLGIIIMGWVLILLMKK